LSEDFWTLGGTSLDCVSLLVDIEEHFKIEIEYKKFIANSSFTALFNFIKQEKVKKENSGNAHLLESGTIEKDDFKDIIDNIRLTNIDISTALVLKSKRNELASIQELSLLDSLFRTHKVFEAFIVNDIEISILATKFRDFINAHTLLHSIIIEDSNDLLSHYYLEISNIKSIYIPVIDLSAYANQSKLIAIEQIVKFLVSYKINVFGDILYRLLVIQIDKKQSICCVIKSHLLTDGSNIFKDALSKSIKATDYSVYVQERTKEMSKLDKNSESKIRSNIQDFVQSCNHIYKILDFKNVSDKLQKIDFSLDYKILQLGYEVEVVILAVLGRVLGGLLNVECLPFRIFYNGRKYKDKTYHNIFADLHDLYLVNLKISQGETIQETMNRINQQLKDVFYKELNMCNITYSLLKDDDSLAEWLTQSAPFSLNIVIEKDVKKEDIIKTAYSFAEKYKKSSVQFFGVKIKIDISRKKIIGSIKCRQNYVPFFRDLQQNINNEYSNIK
jgi:hypothetical protein